MISFINMALILPHSQMGHFMFSSVYLGYLDELIEQS